MDKGFFLRPFAYWFVLFLFESNENGLESAVYMARSYLKNCTPNCTLRKILQLLVISS